MRAAIALSFHAAPAERQRFERAPRPRLHFAPRLRVLRCARAQRRVVDSSARASAVAMALARAHGAPLSLSGTNLTSPSVTARKAATRARARRNARDGDDGRRKMSAARDGGARAAAPGSSKGAANAGARGKENASRRRRRRARARDDDGDREIKLIVTDVDGTLLDGKQALGAATERALRRASELGVSTVVATGKTRGPWARDLYARLGDVNANMPGLFIQGLVVCDGAGKVISSRTLESGKAKEILRFARTRGCVAVAFCNDRIVCATRNPWTDKVLDYGEPVPVECGDLIAACDGLEINKILLFGEDEAVTRFRAEAAVVLADACDITTAVPGMLEFLPKGASKGSAVRELCETMGIDAANVLAIGDGENDVEMLTFAGVGVAVGNASAAAKSVADVVLEETNDQNAVAAAVEKYVLGPRAREMDALDKATAKSEQTPAEEAASAKAKRLIDDVQARVNGNSSDAPSKASPPPAPSAVPAASATKVLPTKVPPLSDEERAARIKADAEVMAHQARIKAEMEEKMIGILRKVVKGAQSVSESVVEKASAKNTASMDDDEFEETVNTAFGAADADEGSGSFDSFDEDELAEMKQQQLQEMERAAEASKQLLERQRANAARLKKLNEELEAAKAALAQSRGDNASTSVPSRTPASDAESKERAKAEMIVAKTSLKKAIVKAEVDAKNAEAAVKEDEAKDAAAAKAPSGLFGFVASAFKTVSAMTSAESIQRQREAERATAKANVLSRVVYCDGGRSCTPDTFARIQEQIKALESKNPTKRPAASSLMLGRWSCAFTNSSQILGTDNFIKQNGPVFFSFDIETQRCEIQRSWPALVERATMTTTRDGTKLDLNIEQSKVLGIPLPQRNVERDYSSLEVTYLDLDLAVCRGCDEKVYVFIQNDPSYRLSADGTQKMLR